MSIYIPEFKINIYGPIVASSIIIGLIVACILMSKANVKKETIIFTAILTFVSILICSACVSIALSGNIRRVGFVGAGGALGLLLGAVLSALIHNDHVAESVSAWVITAPLMYGLAKIGCHFAGCCNGIPYHGIFKLTYEIKGDGYYFPVQLLETVVFVIIFLFGLIFYIRKQRKAIVAAIVLISCAVAKVSIEFLREEHMGKVITGYQILVLVIAFAGVAALYYIDKKVRV